MPRQYRKATVTKGTFKGQTASIEGTDHDVWGRSVWDMAGNPAALNYAIRSAQEGLSFGGKHYYGKIGAFGHVLHESELQFEKED